MVIAGSASGPDSAQPGGTTPRIPPKERPRGTTPRIPPKESPGKGELVLRLAARVVLLDPQNRILLMRYDEGPPNGIHWATPGGGLNDGEDYQEAAIRELAEETGWTDITLLSEIHRRSHTMEYADTIVRQSERLYLARTDQECREITGVEAMHVADGIAAWRWWTVAELELTAQTIWPADLANVIRSALRNGASA